MFKRLQRFGLDAFILSLLAATALAALWPDLCRTDGLIRLDAYATYGVAIVFLLYGLSLSPEKLRAGLLNWRLHSTVQLTTFLLFPLLGWALVLISGNWLTPALALGIFYLCALPSTVSSSVAMTSIAHGNVPGAIFNASLSSLLGVFITPLWVNAFLNTQGISLPLGPIILKIVLLVLLPIALGQVLRPILKHWVERHVKALRLLDRATIIAIVANSFADSMHEGVWAQQGLGALLQILMISLMLFWLVFGLLSLICQGLGFSREDRIAALFCGSKKSLAAGAPMARIMFSGDPMLGLIIAPLMLFHLLQLMIASVLARRFADSRTPE